MNRYDETGHAEPWRNELARDLNRLLDIAEESTDAEYALAVGRTVERVADFEQIKAAP